MPYLYLYIYGMIDDELLYKLAMTYDDLNVYDSEASKAAYEKCMQDPDCRARYVERATQRVRQYRERNKLDPTTETARRVKEYEAKDTASRKVLRESGSLDGMALKLRQQIATLKSESKKILVRKGITNVEMHPVYQQILQDVGELSYLQSKLMEFARSLQVVAPNQPLAPEKIQDLLNIDAIAKSYLQKFSKYGGISKTIYEVLTKLKEIAGDLVVLTKPEPVSLSVPIESSKVKINHNLDNLIDALEEQSKSLTNVPKGEISNLQLAIRKLRRHKDIPDTIKSLRNIDPRIKKQLPIIYDIIAAMY